jgi:hypothetical protein
MDLVRSAELHASSHMVVSMDASSNLIGSSKVVTIYFHDAHFIFSYFDDTVAM